MVASPRASASCPLGPQRLSPRQAAAPLGDLAAVALDWNGSLSRMELVNSDGTGTGARFLRKETPLEPSFDIDDPHSCISPTGVMKPSSGRLHESVAEASSTHQTPEEARESSPRTCISDVDQQSSLTHDASIMGEVQDRLSGRLDIARMASTPGQGPERTVRLTGLTRTSDVLLPPHAQCQNRTPQSPWSMPRMRTADGTPNTYVTHHSDPEKDPRESPRTFQFPRISFTYAVINAVTISVLIASLAMFLPVVLFSEHMRNRFSMTSEALMDTQSTLIRQYTTNVASQSRANILQNVSAVVQRSVLDPPGRALDVLWGYMRTQHMMDLTWDGNSEASREALARRALVELLDQWRASGYESGYHQLLSVGFKNDQFVGASVHCMSGCDVPLVEWYGSSKKSGTSLLNTWMVDTGNCTRDSLYTTKLNRTGMSSSSWSGPTGRPWYIDQIKLTEKDERGALSAYPVRIWSELYPFVTGQLGLTLTSPLTLCGDYSCIDGVIAADITLPGVGQSCFDIWDEFREVLAGPMYGFQIHANNSAVFVVNHFSRRFQFQEGLLVAQSDLSALPTEQLTPAIDSSDGIVNRTAGAIYNRFGSWNASALVETQQFFSYRRHGADQGDFRECDVRSTKFHDQDANDCMSVETLSVALDGDTRWLLVVVSPAAAFFHHARSTEERVEADVENTLDVLDMLLEQMLHNGVVVFGVGTAVSICIGWLLGYAVSGPLRKLSKSMQRLSVFDFSGSTDADRQAFIGQRSWIKDVSELQDSFGQLVKGISTFARFVPEAVVKEIVRGHERCGRLYVDPRRVTIMFSDIRNFTTISEKLSLKDLLFMLTRYLSIMTRIVEDAEGVVTEILGDGLLVFWNTPLNVEEHAAKACSAALAMQQALIPLNEELAEDSLPQLAVRIGLHTGNVLSGNIGSDSKMKFGCMGDPVNLASRLEGLCKVYGVSVICSGETWNELPEDAGFICRKLDFTQVSGKRTPTLIYEVMGQDCSDQESVGELEASQESGNAFDSDSVCVVGTAVLPSFRRAPTAMALEALENSMQALHGIDGSNLDVGLQRKFQKVPHHAGIAAAHACSTISTQSDVMRKTRAHAAMYEDALEAYLRASFLESRDAAKILLAEHPDDAACQRLLARAKEHIDPQSDCVRSFSAEELRNWNGVSVITEK